MLKKFIIAIQCLNSNNDITKKYEYDKYIFIRIEFNIVNIHNTILITQQIIIYKYLSTAATTAPSSSTYTSARAHMGVGTPTYT